MATVETKIWRALKARIDTLPGGFPVAMPMKEFAKPVVNSKPAPYVEARHMPNNVNRIQLPSDGEHDRMGILQLSLMYPLALKTPAEDMIEHAGLIAAHFPTDHKMTFDGVTVRVEKAPDISQGFRDGDDAAYWRLPVSIRWQSFS